MRHNGHNGAGSKTERDQLRRTMQQQGCTLQEMADEIGRRWGYRPRQAWRHARGLTQDEVAARYNQRLNDSSAPMTGKRISDFEAWPVGGSKPTLPVLNILAGIYDTELWKLVDQHDRDSMSSHERAALRRPLTEDARATRNTQAADELVPYSRPLPVDRETVTLVREWEPSFGPYSSQQSSQPSLSDVIMTAASQSRQHAESAQGQIMPEATLDEVTAEVRRLSKEHLYADPLSTFSDTLRARDQIYRFLERKQYPRQSEHLYYLASIVCILLAHDSVGYGAPQAALDHARAGWAYAEIIGHNSLRVESRRLQAGLAYIDKRPQRALDLALSVTSWATEPIARSGLYNAIALYSATLGRKDDASNGLATALDSHESATGNSELYDQVGGVFYYSRAKLLQTSSTTHYELADLDSAEINATEALYRYEEGPADLRAFGSEALARIELSRVRMVRGNIDGTLEALRPIFDLPIQQRRDPIAAKLKELRLTIRGQAIERSAPGQQLVADIEEFLDVTATRVFPGIGRS